MKLLITICSLLFATSLFSQEAKPTYEKVDDLIKATFYYEDGKVNQVGYFKDKKPHGKWISYDVEGKKLSKGNYELGVKTGKWFFWDGEELSEVNYSNNEIASVKIWDNESTIVSAFRK